MKKSFSSTLIRAFVLFVSLFCLCVSASFADAKPKPKKELQEYEVLFEQGQKAYKDGDYKKAKELFIASNTIAPRPPMLYNIGIVCVVDADYECAVDHYSRFIAQPGIDSDARDDAFERLEKCKKFLEAIRGNYGGGSGGAASGGSGKPSKKAMALAASGSCVNLNTAGVTELATLDGVGPKTAEKIFAYRNEHGAFQKNEDLKNVKGIKDATYRKIEPGLCPISGSSAAPVAAPAAQAAPAPAAAPKAPVKSEPAKKADKPKDTKPAKAVQTTNTFEI